MKVELTPLDKRAAEVLASRRGISVDVFVSELIRREVAIEFVQGTRAEPTTPQPIGASPMGKGGEA